MFMYVQNLVRRLQDTVFTRRTTNEPPLVPSVSSNSNGEHGNGESHDELSVQAHPFIDDDVEEQFAAWEKDRQAACLRNAAQCEELAMNLIARAQLLRQAVQCEEEGLGFLAEQLRDRAESVVTTYGVAQPVDAVPAGTPNGEDTAKMFL